VTPSAKFKFGEEKKKNIFLKFSKYKNSIVEASGNAYEVENTYTRGLGK
jgi:hypothetical protein